MLKNRFSISYKWNRKLNFVQLHLSSEWVRIQYLECSKSVAQQILHLAHPIHSLVAREFQQSNDILAFERSEPSVQGDVFAFTNMSNSLIGEGDIKTMKTDLGVGR